MSKLFLNNKTFVINANHAEVKLNGMSYGIIIDSNDDKDDIKSQLRDQIQRLRQRLRNKVDPKQIVYNHLDLTRVGGVYNETNLILKAAGRQKLRTIGLTKSPKTKHFHIGVEIEFLSEWSQSKLKTELINAKLEQFVNLTTDNSVGDDVDCECGSNSHCESCDSHDCDCYSRDCECGPSGHELRVIAPLSKIYTVIEKTCEVLQRAKAYANKTCGLHVHLDMRGRDHITSFANLVNMQKLLYSMVPISRRTGRWSKPTRGTKFRETNTRYLGINPCSYRKHKTIEVRIHSGTVDATKINNWIRLLHAIAKAPMIKSAPRTFSGLRKRLGLSANLTSYIAYRVNKFVPEHKEYSFGYEKVKASKPEKS